jgi:dienelactone hydrolase
MWMDVAGGSTPRRIVLTGFCVGGSLATIAACWAALQSPTSDVRCITFGAPCVGNAAFVEAYRYVNPARTANRKNCFFVLLPSFGSRSLPG